MEAVGIVLMSDITDERADARIFDELFAHIGVQNWPLLTDDVRTFFQTATPAAGRYTLDNYHPSDARGDELALNGVAGAASTSAESTLTFEVTGEHLSLMRHLNVRNLRYFSIRSDCTAIAVMDPKRPYGDMTYFYLEMVDALGESLPRDVAGEPAPSPEQIQRLDRLHSEMLFAVRAF
jgi:hypothetical protein